MKNINSFAENMASLVTVANNQISLLTGIQDSMVTNKSQTSFLMTDPETKQVNSYTIPAYQGVINQLDGVKNSIKSLIDGKGTVSLGDGTAREVKLTPLAKIPTNVNTYGNPTTFNIDSNWFFEDLMFPGITVSVDLVGQVDPTADRVRVKRVLIDANNVSAQRVWTNMIVGTKPSYMDLVSLLSSQGIEYAEDEETLEFPLTLRNYQGVFEVIKTEVINGELWYYLDTLSYNEVTEAGVNTGSTQTLDIGSLVSYNDMLLEIQSINFSDMRVAFKPTVGVANPGVGSLLDYYEEPFKSKKLNIRIGIHEYNIIYFRPVNEAFNIMSSGWGTPLVFFSDDLTSEEDGTVLSEYYATSVIDWGNKWVLEARERSVTASDGVIPDSPVLTADDFSVVQINTQINAALDTAEFRAIVSQIETTKSNISSLRETIAAQKSELQSITDLKLYNNYQSQISTNTNELNQLQIAYRTLLNQAQDLVKDNRGVVVEPKYHIRGFFPIPAPKTNISTTSIKTTQQVIGFEIAYRYVKEDATAVDLKTYTYTDSDQSSKVSGVYTDWNITASKVLEKAYNSVSGAFEWVDESVSDGTAININQIDIPITKGEKVEFKVRSISEAGYPAMPLKSSWSNSVIISFPDSLSTESEAVNLINDINSENINASIDSILNSLGIYTHLEDSIPNTNSVNGIYYKHESKLIAYESTNESDGSIETISVQKAIDQIKETAKAINASDFYTKAETDKLFESKCPWVIVPNVTDDGYPNLKASNTSLYVNKMYLTPHPGDASDGTKEGYDTWILDVGSLDANGDGKIDIADINAVNNTLLSPGLTWDVEPPLDLVLKIQAIQDFILGNGNDLKKYWKRLY